MNQGNELEAAIRRLDQKTFSGLRELAQAGIRSGKIGCRREFLFTLEGSQTTALSFAPAKLCGDEVPAGLLTFGVSLGVRLCGKCCTDLLEMTQRAV